MYKKQNIYAPLKTSVTLPRDPRGLLSASNAGTNLVSSSLRPPLGMTTSNKNWSMDGLIETYAWWILETYALLNRAFLFQMFYTNMLAKNFFRYNFWFTYVSIIQLNNAQLCIFFTILRHPVWQTRAAVIFLIFIFYETPYHLVWAKIGEIWFFYSKSQNFTDFDSYFLWIYSTFQWDLFWVDTGYTQNIRNILREPELNRNPVL